MPPIQWNAEIRTSEIGKTPKSKRMGVWFLNVWALKIGLKTFRFWTFGRPNVRFCSEIGQMGQNVRFGRFRTFWTEILAQKVQCLNRTKTFGLSYNSSDFERKFLSEIRTIWKWDTFSCAEIGTCSDFGHWLYLCKNKNMTSKI